MWPPTSVVGGKNLPQRAAIAGFAGGVEGEKAWFYWVFRIGTPLADRQARNVGRHARPCWSSAMFLALGAASSAIDALKALTSPKSSAKSTGASQNGKSPFDLLSAGSQASAGAGPASGGGSQISPQTMSALLDAQSQSAESATTASKSRSSALKDLFAQIDGNGDGKITKSEFEEALGAGGTNLPQADSVFGKLDKDGDGSVSLKELASALKGGKKAHHAASESDGSNSDPFSQALQGASSTSVANSDGSVTTSLTYADGSKVTMTSAAGKSSATSAASSYNFIEQMIQRQAQAISSAATSSLSVSA
jgi:Ca2+-binding EF-hand superfamily protein